MNQLTESSTITAKGQTTIPKAVRQALGVTYGGRITFRVEGTQVTLHAEPEPENQDPALTPFLTLLAQDLAARPKDSIRPIPETLATRLQTLATQIGETTPDDPIEGETAL